MDIVREAAALAAAAGADPAAPGARDETAPAETVPAETVPAETVPAETVPAETVPAGAVLDETVLDDAVERMPLEGHDGRSGARLERLRLPDGTTLIVKWLEPADDLAMRVTGDVAGREHTLWQSGVLGRLPAGVGHALVATWPTATGAAVLMRDLTGHMLGWASRLSRAEFRRVLTVVDRMHGAFRSAPPVGVGYGLDVRVTIMSPGRMRPLATGPNPLPAMIVRGWEIFADLAPADVAKPVLHLLDHPDPLVQRLADAAQTLIHGDLSLPNIALDGDQVILVDWGLATVAPAEVEIAWFLADSGMLVDATHDEILADHRDVTGGRLDPATMELALLAGLAGLGWSKALGAATRPDPAARAQHLEDLQWWYAHARAALPLLES